MSQTIFGIPVCISYWLLFTSTYNSFRSYLRPPDDLPEPALERSDKIAR
jgi:hypothetical protein